ncbi:hypothetical protein GLOTRDRAFT_132083 [Gloeophyllum trabeum ATCC 11539]|uniref:Uncharacterized protein n=1 Tax=Gloeophyllum trabeum (strain ATCC 11539 / FP-39264 / Madison 617) TaxID=670483 RepID=S7RF46_GLOTA|nr:uncharacterized protein GLOTRDRAFT_132083 [Gloeophyllum trabeum ATCC 11539]EPQ52850.1 hypothetical protein GLOTRDRAFT_132083 [Gloeophyllum trabeum ATCC 11539]
MITAMGAVALLEGRYREEVTAPTPLAYMICQVATSRIYFNLHHAAQRLTQPRSIDLDVVTSALEFAQHDANALRTLAEP